MTYYFFNYIVSFFILTVSLFLITINLDIRINADHDIVPFILCNLPTQVASWASFVCWCLLVVLGMVHFCVENKQQSAKSKKQSCRSYDFLHFHQFALLHPNLALAHTLSPEENRQQWPLQQRTQSFYFFTFFTFFILFFTFFTIILLFQSIISCQNA